MQHVRLKIQPRPVTRIHCRAEMPCTQEISPLLGLAHYVAGQDLDSLEIPEWGDRAGELVGFVGPAQLCIRLRAAKCHPESGCPGNAAARAC